MAQSAPRSLQTLYLACQASVFRGNSVSILNIDHYQHHISIASERSMRYINDNCQVRHWGCTYISSYKLKPKSTMSSTLKKPAVKMGTHNWTPSTAEAFNTSTSHRPTPHIEMLLPLGPSPLHTYDNTNSFNNQQDESLPKLFLDVIAVREEVYVRELGQPLECQFDPNGDGVAVHWVVYITDWVDSSSPLVGFQPGMAPMVTDLGGDATPTGRLYRRMPVGCVRLRPVWAEVGLEKDRGERCPSRLRAALRTLPRHTPHTYVSNQKAG